MKWSMIISSFFKTNLSLRLSPLFFFFLFFYFLFLVFLLFFWQYFVLFCFALFSTVNQHPEEFSETVLEVLKAEHASFSLGASSVSVHPWQNINQYNDEFISKNKGSLPHRLAGARSLVLLGTKPDDNRVKTLLTDLSGTNVTYKVSARLNLFCFVLFCRCAADLGKIQQQQK